MHAILRLTYNATIMLLLPSDRWNGDMWIPQGLVVTQLPELPQKDDFQLSRPLSLQIVDEILKSSLSWEILPAEVVDNDQIYVSTSETKPDTNAKSENLLVGSVDYCSLQLVLSLLGPRDLAVCQVSVSRTSCFLWKTRTILNFKDFCAPYT
jgi:hypothetical protein